MKPDKIYILTDAPLPTGMAPTNRILSYAKGFIINGIESEVIVFRKTDRSNLKQYESNKGVVKGIKYKYLYSHGIKSSYFIKRRIDDILGDLRLFFTALFFFNKDSAIIYYSSRTSPALFLKIARFIRRFKLLKEESEHPSVYQRKMDTFTSSLFSGIHYRLFDGYLLMTRNLVSYFKGKYPGKPAVLVPMTVDLERFTRNEIRRKKSITYIGSLNDEKDGVNFLLEVFLKICKEFPDYILNLYGKAQNQKVYQSYQNFVSQSGLTQRVFFRGSVSNDEVPEILLESGVLVMARPDSIQARNGFPTKLGEYLATGNPVVVTSVGEIPVFLQDKVSAFIAKPGDVESLKDKISEALGNDGLARDVGINGRKVAEKYFNNVTQAESIIDFINEL